MTFEREIPKTERMIQRAFKPALAIGLGAGLLVLLISSHLGPSLENQVFDSFMRWTAEPRKWPDEIVVLLIDETSLQKMGEKYGWRWPWPREAHSALVAYLKKAGAREVAFDVLFSEESKDAIEDDRFAACLQAAGNVWLSSKQIEKGKILEPLPSLRQAVGNRLAFVNADRDTGGVVRHYPTRDFWSQTSRKPLALGVAEKVGFQWKGGDRMMLRWHARAEQLDERHLVSAGFLISLEKPILDGLLKERAKEGGFDEFDPKQVADVIRALPPLKSAEWFSDKIVLIGCSGAGTSDELATPLSPHEPGVMVHATALANLIRGDDMRPVPHWMELGLIFLSSCGVTWICIRARTIRWQSALTFLFLCSIVGIAWAGFQSNIWIPPLMAVVAGAVSFTGIMTYNYFIEDRQKRELKQLFSDFVSPDVLAEIQASPEGINLRGDRRMGTVLFCDLAGFTTFTESSTPEQFLDAINTYLAEASKVLMAHGAYVDKFIGDAVMAVFGIPRPEPDHAVQACLAALELQGMMVRLNDRLGKQYSLKLSLRTGLNSGEMIAGPMGYARKLNYSVLGDAVNLASRLEGANKDFGTRIMIGPSTYEQAKQHVETRFLDLLVVKGKTKPVEVRELVARQGGLTSTQIQLHSIYHEGIEFYRARCWTDAETAFQRVLQIDPEDGPSRTYLQRCSYYRRKPPGADWDGSFKLDHK